MFSQQRKPQRTRRQQQQHLWAGAVEEAEIIRLPSAEQAAAEEQGSEHASPRGGKGVYSSSVLQAPATPSLCASDTA